jgi:hypothetical protein
MSTVYCYHSKASFTQLERQTELLPAIESKISQCLKENIALDVCFKVRLVNSRQDTYIRIALNPGHAIGVDQQNLSNRGVLITNMPNWKDSLRDIQAISTRYQQGGFLLKTLDTTEKEEFVRYRQFFSNSKNAEPNYINQINTAYDFLEVLEQTNHLLEIAPEGDLPEEILESFLEALQVFANRKKEFNRDQIQEINGKIAEHVKIFLERFDRICPDTFAEFVVVKQTVKDLFAQTLALFKV